MKYLMTCFLLALTMSTTLVAQDKVQITVTKPFASGSVTFHFFLYATPAGKHGEPITAVVPGGPEPFTDSNGNGQYDPGEPYDDDNNSGSYTQGDPNGIIGNSTKWIPPMRGDTADEKMTKIRAAIFNQHHDKLKLGVALNPMIVEDGRRDPTAPALPAVFLDYGLACFRCDDNTAQYIEIVNIKSGEEGSAGEQVQSLVRLSGTPKGGSFFYGDDVHFGSVATNPSMSIPQIHTQLAAAIPGSVITPEGVRMPEYLATGDWFFYSDVSDRGLNISVTQGPRGSGQAPVQGVASLDVNNATANGFSLASGRPGPYVTGILPVELVNLTLTGSPGQAVVLILGDINVNAWNFGPFGQLDLSNFQVIANGTLPGGWNPLWVIPPSGVLELTFPAQPALSGTVAGLQAAILHPTQVVQLSNAVEVYFQ